MSGVSTLNAWFRERTRRRPSGPSRFELLPKSTRIGLIVLFIASLYLMPFWPDVPVLGWIIDTPGTSFKNVLTDKILIFVLVAIGLNVVVGLAGLLGAGRTELLECLFGASPRAFRGIVRLGGRRVAFRHPSEALAAGVVLITEDRKRLGIFEDLPVGTNITLSSLPRASSGGIISSARDRQLIGQTIDRLRIKTAGPRGRITQLSGGNQQKCLVGRGLLTNPRLLLLDDPTRGVDVGAKAELYQLIDGLVREGLAVIVTSSELPELLTMSDRIVVLCEGRVTAELTRAEATEQRIMEAATMRAGRRPGRD